jgi:hypothetical protein
MLTATNLTKRDYNAILDDLNAVLDIGFRTLERTVICYRRYKRPRRGAPPRPALGLPPLSRYPGVPEGNAALSRYPGVGWGRA